MSTVSFTLGDETALALRVGAEDLTAELRLAAAVKLYELGRLSSGAAAELAGIPRPLFLSRLAEYGVATFRLSESEIDEDASRG